MKSSTSYEEARAIMGDNIIGPEELPVCEFVDISGLQTIPEIPYASKILGNKKDDYMLIFGVERLCNGRLLTIRNMIETFGSDPQKQEPCFYNQDWYDKEGFIDTKMNCGWYLIRKKVYESSRAVQPDDLLNQYTFPSAIRCAYSFFVSWKVRNVRLWYEDYVWCSDKDHNGDRIYVGKYHDVDGVNKDGFSIHRHLSLRQCYGCVD